MSTKFTDELETDGSITFLDTLVFCKYYSRVKVHICHKKTHRDQYLNFESHHGLSHNPGIGVIRTLCDRCENIVTKATDAEKKAAHVNLALAKCGYPKWSFKVRQQLDQRTAKPKRLKKATKD